MLWVEWWPPKISTRLTSDVTVFGGRVFADEIKDLKSSWIRVGPKSNDSALRRDRKGDDPGTVEETT